MFIVSFSVNGCIDGYYLPWLNKIAAQKFHITLPAKYCPKFNSQHSQVAKTPKSLK
jgi:hypothetical protein